MNEQEKNENRLAFWDRISRRECVVTAESLDDLLAALIACRDADPDQYAELPWDELPVFGDREPANTMGVWSWDDERVLVGVGGALTLRERCQCMGDAEPCDGPPADQCQEFEGRSYDIATAHWERFVAAHGVDDGGAQ